MPRQARLDAPGTLHHVMERGIERAKIFRKEEDRVDLLKRIAVLCQEEAWKVCMGDGDLLYNLKSHSYYVWPVRGRQ